MADTVKVELKLNDFAINNIEKKAMTGMFKMAYDIAAQARLNAPYVTGALRNSIRVEEVATDQIHIIAGSNRVPYAAKREEGPNKNPATEHYMENAQKAIMVGNYLEKYFGDITK